MTPALSEIKRTPWTVRSSTPGTGHWVPFSMTSMRHGSTANSHGLSSQPASRTRVKRMG